jgi:hypothetical protein
LIGTLLAVLTLAPGPATASWTGAADGGFSGSDTVILPVAKRPQAPGAELGPAATAVLLPTLVLTLLAGLAGAALVELARRARSGPRPRPGRGPPLAVR